MPAADFSNQIHDFDPGFGDAGLFWTIPLSDGSVSANPGAGRASYHLTALPITDYGSIPNGLFHFASPRGAIVTFDVEWSGVVSRSSVSDPTTQFQGEFAMTNAHVTWSALEGGSHVFTSASSGQTVDFAEVGHQQNGAFFGS